MFGYRKVSSGKEKNIKENNFLILGFAIKNIKLKLVKKLSIKKKKKPLPKNSRGENFHNPKLAQKTETSSMIRNIKSHNNHFIQNQNKQTIT